MVDSKMERIVAVPCTIGDHEFTLCHCKRMSTDGLWLHIKSKMDTFFLLSWNIPLLRNGSWKEWTGKQF